MGEKHFKKQDREKKIINVEKPLIAGVIGKGGCNLKEMAEKSGCKIHFQSAQDHGEPDAPYDKQLCVIQGFPDQIPLAEQLVMAKVAEVAEKESKKNAEWTAWPKKDDWSSWQPKKEEAKEPCPFFAKGWCGYGEFCNKA